MEEEEEEGRKGKADNMCLPVEEHTITYSLAKRIGHESHEVPKLQLPKCRLHKAQSTSWTAWTMSTHTADQKTTGALSCCPREGSREGGSPNPVRHKRNCKWFKVTRLTVDKKSTVRWRNHVKARETNSCESHESIHLFPPSFKYITHCHMPGWNSGSSILSERDIVCLYSTYWNQHEL